MVKFLVYASVAMFMVEVCIMQRNMFLIFFCFGLVVKFLVFASGAMFLVHTTARGS